MPAQESVACHHRAKSSCSLILTAIYLQRLSAKSFFCTQCRACHRGFSPGEPLSSSCAEALWGTGCRMGWGRVSARLGFLPAQNIPLIMPIFPPRMILTGARFGSSGAQWTSHWTQTGSRCRLRGAGREKTQNPRWFRFYFPASPTTESPATPAHPYLA